MIRMVRQIQMRWITFSCAILLVASVILSSGVSSVNAETTDQTLKDTQSKQEELAEQIANMEKVISQLSASQNELDGKLDWLNSRNAEQKALYMEKTQQLAAALKSMEAANQEYLDAEKKLVSKQEEYRSRLQVMFAYRQKSYLQLFIESGNLQNFFTTIQFMALVAEADQQLIEELEIATDDAELKKQTSIKQSADMEIVVANLKTQLDKIESEKSTIQSQLQNIQNQLSDKEQAEERLNEESESIGQEIRALQQKISAERSAKATEAAQQNQNSQSLISSKGWIWPYPADKNTYSPYGWRFHPIYRVRKFHSGADIGGSYGAPIVAARDGVVIIVRNPVQGQNTGGSGYGNYVVIAHDGQYSTLYGHMKETLVKVGQEVKAGDRIGLCGSTGTSTGAHLHFELMIDGSTTDPIPYIR